MATIYDFPQSWNSLLVSPGRFRVRPFNQIAKRPWIGGMVPKGPISQVWLADQAFAPVRDPSRQEIQAFFTRLRGSSGVMRFYDATKLAPYYDRTHSPTPTYFSDGTTFADGTGFENGLLPPQVFVATAATRGSRFLTLGGYPASTASVVHRGDLFEVWPNGIPSAFPHLYTAMYDVSSDANGKVGFDIEPGLRADIAVSDPVNLRYASSVFRLIDDTQGELETSDGSLFTGGFSLVEATDLVP